MGKSKINEEISLTAARKISPILKLGKIVPKEVKFGFDLGKKGYFGLKTKSYIQDSMSMDNTTI